MGLLDGDLREVFGSVFAPLLLDAEIIHVTLTPDGQGGMTETSETAPAKGMVEQYSAYERARDAIPSTDVKLIVLQKDVAIRPDLSSRVTIRGQTYSIQSIEEDPAQAAWTLQGRPILGAGANVIYLNVPVRAAISARALPGLVEPVSEVILQIARATVAPEIGEGAESVEVEAAVPAIAAAPASPALLETPYAISVEAAASPPSASLIESPAATIAALVSAPLDPDIIEAAVEISAPIGVVVSAPVAPALTEVAGAETAVIAVSHSEPALCEKVGGAALSLATAPASPVLKEPAGAGVFVLASSPAEAEASSPAQGPQILWSITGQASGDFDWTGQELEEGDVVFCMMAGTWSHHGTNYPTTANGPVTNNGFFYVWTPGDFQRTMSLTARVVTAGNIGERVATRGNVHDSGVVFAVRGLDLDQFTTEPGGGGWPWLADQARVAFQGGTNANPPPIGGVEAGDMVLGVCNVWQNSPIISAPAPYIEERVYLSSGRSPSDRFTGISYLIAEAAGTYDPDQWSGFQSGVTGGAVTLRLSPL